MDNLSLNTVSDLQKNYFQLLNLVEKNKKLTLYRYKKPAVVLLSPAFFLRLIKIKEKYEEFLALRKIDNYQKAKKAGKLLQSSSVEDLFK